MKNDKYNTKCGPDSKFGTLINDQHVPAPQRKVLVSVLKSQGGVPQDHTLFRDVSPAGDVPLKGDEVVDLAEGNVFYSRKGCFESPAKPCSGKPKFAWFVDDRHEVSLQDRQTGESLRGLFGLKEDLCLLRDFNSPNDEQIAVEEVVEFGEGPVFITRGKQDSNGSITVTVDGDKVEIPRKGNSPASILTAAGLNPAKRYLIELKGNEQIPYRENPNDKIKVAECQQFVTGSLDPVPVS